MTNRRKSTPPNIPHLQRDRHGTYYFRFTYYGKTIRRSLNTKNLALATMKVSSLNWQLHMKKQKDTASLDQLLEGLQHQVHQRVHVTLPNGIQFSAEDINTVEDTQRVSEMIREAAELDNIGIIEPDVRASMSMSEREIARQIALPQASLLPAEKFAQKTLGQASLTLNDFAKHAKAYLKEMSKPGVNSEKTVAEKQAVYTELETFAREHKATYINDEIAQSYQEELVASNVGQGRINKKIGYLSTLFDWMLARKRVSHNLFKDLKVGIKGKRRPQVDSYRPFTQQDLNAIFNAESYREYERPGYEHFKWLPFLLLYTGARPDELASLKLSQVCTDVQSGVHYFDITKAKNTVSQRRIPLHKTIVESTFLNYVERLRQQPNSNGQLFPGLEKNKNGYCKNVSRRFNEIYLPSLKINDDRKKLYSMRHTFITRMTELNVNASMLMALVGHFEQSALDLSAPHFKNYQGAKSIQALKDVIDQFDIQVSMTF